MTLLHWDGFDLGDTNLRYGTSGWSTTASTRYGQGLAANGQAAANKIIPASAEVYYGIAVSCSSLDAADRITSTILGDAGATSHLSWTIKLGTLTARSGGFTGSAFPGGAIAGPFLAAGWYFIETYAKIADSGGRFVLRLDGNTVFDYTGDTKNAGTSTNIDMIRMFANGTPMQIDDWYICDGVDATASQGAPNNGFLGDHKVITLAPTGEGATTGMTPSSGANWTTQDERPYSSTDYVQGAAGTKDTYAMSDLPAGAANVKGVQVISVAKKTDAGAASLRNVLRSGGTDYVGSSVSLGASDQVLTSQWFKDPATSALWLPSGVNAIQAGVEAV